MSNKPSSIGVNVPALRIILIQASEIYYANNYTREKIEINPKEPKYLKVVYGLGYKIQKY